MPAKKTHGRRRTALEMLTRSHERLDGVLHELATALADADEDAVDDGLAFLRGPYLRHVTDEEDTIFPRLDAAEHGALIASLTAEHRAHETLIEQLRSAWHLGNADAAGDMAKRLRRELARHSKIEESQLWPAIAALPAAELEEAHDQMRARRPRR